MQHTSFDNNDTDRIEDRLERDRANLASSIDELQDRMSFDSLARDAMDSLKSNAGVYTKSVDHAIRANPMAVVLTGVGLAWLIFGSARKSKGKSPKTEPYNRWESEGGMAYDVEESKYGMRGEGLGQHDEDWSQKADGLRAKASAALRKIEAAAREKFDAARDYAGERASVLGEFSAGLKESLGHGLSGMSETARDKVLKARHAAYSARVKMDGRTVSRTVEDHPLVAGAVALALGMVAAALMPRTDTEDRLMGSERDRLMREAARLFDEEKGRATNVAREVVGELTEEAKGVAATLAARVSDAAQDVASSVATPVNAPAGHRQA